MSSQLLRIYILPNELYFDSFGAFRFSEWLPVLRKFFAHMFVQNGHSQGNNADLILRLKDRIKAPAFSRGRHYGDTRETFCVYSRLCNALLHCSCKVTWISPSLPIKSFMTNEFFVWPVICETHFLRYHGRLINWFYPLLPSHIFESHQ